MTRGVPILAIVLLLVVAGIAAQSCASRPDRATPPSHDAPVAGLPADVDQLAYPTRTDGGPPLRILRNDAYVCAYDEDRHNPAWVTYSLAGAASRAAYRREGAFATDTRTAACVRSDEYTRSGYDRGHMAPSFAIFAFYGEPAERQTYLTSNIVPQRHALNAGPWERLEELEARVFAEHEGKIRTWCGPAYTEPVARIGHGVEVPSATWKVLVRTASDGRLEALAFLMPQTAAPNDPPAKYLTSVRAIESAAHLDFFPELPKSEQDALETRPAATLWQ